MGRIEGNNPHVLIFPGICGPSRLCPDSGLSGCRINWFSHRPVLRHCGDNKVFCLIHDVFRRKAYCLRPRWILAPMDRACAICQKNRYSGWCCKQTWKRCYQIFSGSANLVTIIAYIRISAVIPCGFGYFPPFRFPLMKTRQRPRVFLAPAEFGP